MNMGGGLQFDEVRSWLGDGLKLLNERIDGLLCQEPSLRSRGAVLPTSSGKMREFLCKFGQGKVPVKIDRIPPAAAHLDMILTPTMGGRSL